MPVFACWLPLLLLCIVCLTCRADDHNTGLLNAKAPLPPSALKFFYDADNLSAAEVFRREAELPWQSPDGLLLDPPASRYPAWVMVNLSDTMTPLSRELELRWNNYARLSFYQSGADGRLYHQQGGLAESRPHNGIHEAGTLFPLQPGADPRVLLHLQTDMNYLLPLFVWSDNVYSNHKLTHHTVYAFVLGIITVMMLYNLSLWIFTRDRVYLVYSTYLTAVIGFILAESGIGHHSLWENAPWLRLHAYGLFSVLCFILASLFVRLFLELPKYGGWVLTVNNLAIICWLLALIDYLTGTMWLASASEPLALLTTALGLVMSVYLSFKGNRSAVIFSAAWLAIMVGTVLYVLTISGILSYNPITQFALPLGFVVEVVMLSFALAERINRERKLREQAQEALISLTEQANHELEERVAERTRELERLTVWLQQSNGELQTLSSTDGLTGLSNRRHFDNSLQNAINRSQATGQPLTLILCDIDHFKSFNDTYGHQTGDQCLRSVATVLARHVRREQDCAARYGGEEFALILPGLSVHDARLRAEQLRQDIAESRFRSGDMILAVTMSLGVVTCLATDDTTADMLTHLADQALYQAKREGRNCVRVSGEDNPSALGFT